jgi:hypothetical protein
MNSTPSGPREDQPSSSPPSLKQQAVMTIKILFVTGTVFAAIWMLDLLAAQ